MALPPAASIIAAVSSMVSGREYGEGFPLTLRPVPLTTTSRMNPPSCRADSAGRNSRLTAGAIATAVNGEFIPKTQRLDIVLSEGDRIEVVAPMQGG